MDKNANNKNNTTSTDEVTISRAQYEEFLKVKAEKIALEQDKTKLEQDNAALEQDLSNALERIRLLAKQIYSKSSEKRSHEEVGAIMDALFDEAELHVSIDAVVEFARAENETTEVAAHTRKKKKSMLLENLPEGVATEVVEHRLTGEDALCKTCGSELTVIGKEVKKTLVVIPRQVKVREDWYYTYACKNCENETGETSIKKMPKLKPVIPGSFASPEAVAHIINEKFVMASPIYRLEQEFKRQGIDLSRQTMSNWILTATDLYLGAVYDELHKRLVKHDILHADESPLQVLVEDGRNPSSKSYMWLYRTGKSAKSQIVLYDYKPGRSGEYARNFLKEFYGYLHTDGYEAYHKLGAKVTSVGCWAHLRRKFDEALKAQPKGKSAATTVAQQGLDYCSRLFKLEKKLEKLSVEERYAERLKQEKPILDAFLAWENTLSVTPKSALGRALGYLRNQWPYLINYLQDGRLEITNNRAERSIKSFVIGRKNFLFAATARGAKSSAIMYSLVETAKENRLDPFRYLTYIFKTAPNLNKRNPNWMVPLLPENAPIECSVNYRK